jgi:hypothetical protein
MRDGPDPEDALYLSEKKGIRKARDQTPAGSLIVNHGECLWVPLNAGDRRFDLGTEIGTQTGALRFVPRRRFT